MKVRDGLLDVKRLDQVSRRGARAVDARSRRPLSPRRLRGCRRRSPSSASTSPSSARRTRSTELLDEVVADCPDLLAVGVHKTREALHDRRLHGRADRRARAGRETRTIAVESEDPDRVLAAVRGARAVRPRPNVSVPRGLKALLGFGATPLRGDRRRHELGEVPPRRARGRTARGGSSSTAPR